MSSWRTRYWPSTTRTTCPRKSPSLCTHRRRAGVRMIPELGHFALILALLLSIAQAVFGLGGAARGNAAWLAAGELSGGWAVRVCHARVRGAHMGVRPARFLGALRRHQLELRAADLLPRRRRLGRARGLAVAVVAVPRGLDPGRRRCQPVAGRAVSRPGARHPRHRQHRIPALHAGDIESVRASRPRGRPRDST